MKLINKQYGIRETEELYRVNDGRMRLDETWMRRLNLAVN